MTTVNNRTSEFDIDPIFLQRWSPRAFTGEPLSDKDLPTMLEAARWAPSCYNAQPWRFIYALRDTPNWERFLNLLVPFNRTWAVGCFCSRLPGLELNHAAAECGP